MTPAVGGEDPAARAVSLPALRRPPLHNRILTRLLQSRIHRLLDGSIVGLRVRGVLTGTLHELPVLYAGDDITGLVVYPGRPDTKRWWRNLRRPAALSLLRGGDWQPAVGELLQPGIAGYDEARRAYQRRWPKVRISPVDPLVHIRLVDPGGSSFSRLGRNPLERAETEFALDLNSPSPGRSPVRPNRCLSMRPRSAQ